MHTCTLILWLKYQFSDASFLENVTFKCHVLQLLWFVFLFLLLSVNNSVVESIHHHCVCFKGSNFSQGNRKRMAMANKEASTMLSALLMENTVHVVEDFNYSLHHRLPRDLISYDCLFQDK